jgi:hypothetical protein
MKYTLLSVLVLLSVVGNSQKIDSNLVYRWPDSRHDTMLWDKTYGWYDTTYVPHRTDGGTIMWIMDTVTRHITVDTSYWIVTLRFPPPKNCSCWGKYLFQKYLDPDKRPYPPCAYLKTSEDLIEEQHQH